MVDNKAQNKPQEQPEASAPLAASASSYQKTFGDKMFDLGVYGGLGYIANAAISLFVTRRAVQRKDTHLYKVGRWSEGQFEKLFAHLKETTPLMKKKGAVPYWSDMANNILFLGSGGWLLVVPMKWLEDNKLGMIQKIDEFAGTQPESEEARQAQIDRFSNGPKQSYGSLFLGRAVAYAATITAALPFITETTNVNANMNRFLTKHLKKNMGSLKEPLLMVDGKMTETPAFIDSISKETILAGTASGLHYISSKLFASAGHHMFHAHHPSKAILPDPTRAAMANLHVSEQTPDTQVREAFREAVRVQDKADKEQER